MTNEGINVLSLFDGISCGQVALQRAGIKVNQYFASEIDKHAIAVTQYNWPNTIQLGDVTKIKVEDLPEIDLIFGGSPCQGFSFAGKQLNFNDERSRLFFRFVEILEQLRKVNPKIFFLLENVKMKKESEQVITEILEVSPIEINSNLVSAQNRKRLYWTNISNVFEIENKNIVLKDILETNVCNTLDDEYIKRRKGQKRWGNHFGTVDTLKHNTLCAIGKSDVILLEDLKRYILPIEAERLQTLPDNYTSCIPDTYRYKAIGNGWTVDVISHIFSYLKF